MRLQSRRLAAWLLAGAVLACGPCGPAHAVAAPDFNGTWKLAKPQALFVPADGAPIPFTADGKASYEANKALAAKGDYSFDATMTRCSSPGLPRLMLTPMRLRIFQRPTIVAFSFEWNRLARQIDMPGSFTELHKLSANYNDTVVGTMKGVTKGHWEGDTLVAESSQFAFGKLLDNLIAGSDDLQLRERFRLRDHDTLEDRITITDPQVFTRSWDAVLTYKRVADETFPEDVCMDRRDAGQAPLPH
jgi:hypothetical protein